MKGFAAKRAGRERFATVGRLDAASLAYEVSLGRWHRNVSEQELDLIQLATRSEIVAR